ncbi:quinoprotein relay system zinc metallohydrolase 1 [Novispirillum sp. DQ9]|uniref:quinoprotein relay system zinc metallohydrolase 1 n=1 Tax=Novispirillum sp. DQ9 TaxID=3398612 RepID=UPI003C7D7F5E
MRMIALALAGLLLASPAVNARDGYGLTPRQIAPGSWLLEGTTEDFSRANGGNIVNTGFIVTGGGVVVFDTGPSARYGAEMRAAIEAITAEPVALVIASHQHPDHFLGNQAFPPETLAATAGTIAGIRAGGSDVAANLYRLVGDWMLGTEAVAPTRVLDTRTEEVGGHRLRILALAGHTASDVAVFDETTGVLWASDLVFHDRTPTTPHADIAPWLAALEALEALPFTVLVPGHGAPARDGGPIAQTRDYLRWLDRTLTAAAHAGLSMTEVMRLPIPERFHRMSLLREEFQRSVVHLYPGLEKALLPAVGGSGQ